MSPSANHPKFCLDFWIDAVVDHWAELGGSKHSGKHCSTVSQPCCTNQYQCSTLYHAATISTECGCEKLGSYLLGSRTVGTTGGSCTGGGPSPNPTGVIDPTSVIAGDPA